MALARSQSGPGGLSINTNSANSLFGSGTTPAAGMFGSTAASKPLFGAATTTAAPQSGGLFGSTTGTTTGGLFGNTTSQPQASGLFGATTSQPQAGGLFGAAPATQPQSGGLFGSAPATQPQSGGLFGSAPAQTGGLFGATASTAQPQTGGLFGATTTSQPQTGGLFGSAPKATGGLFGNTNTSQATTSGGLFSNAGSTQNQNTGSGLFGNSTSQPTQSGGLFGGMNQNQNQAKPASSLFSSLTGGQNQTQPQTSGMFSSLNQSQQQQQRPQGFGILGGGLGQSQNQQQQQQQTVPGVRISTENIRGTTRFNDLHDELQREIEFMDNVIQRQVRYKEECDAILDPHEKQLSTIPNDVEFCRRKMMGLEAAKTSDSIAVEKLQKLTASDIEHGKLSGRAIDNLRLPIQYHVSGVWPPKSTPPDSRAQSSEGEAQSFVGYFTSAANELSDTLAKNQKNLSEIEQHLRSVEVSSGQQVASLVARKNGGSGADDDAVKELASALVEFEQGILNVAGKVGSTREGVQSLQLNGFIGGPNGKSINGKRTGIY